MEINVEDFILLFFLGTSIVSGLVVSVILFLREHGNKTSNVLLGTLIFLASVTALNRFMGEAGIMSQFPDLYFLPLSYGLSFAPLFYLFVKSKTISNYRWIWKKEAVHLLLPAIQVVFYFSIGFRSYEFKSWIWREWYGPYLQYIDEGGFVIISIVYLVLAYRLSNTAANVNGWQNELHRWMRRFVLVFLVFVTISSVYNIVDWICWLGFDINIYNIRFVALPYQLCMIFLNVWMIINAWMYSHQSLIFERPKKGNKELDERIKDLFDRQNIHINPDLDLNLLSSLSNETRNNLSKYFSDQQTTFTDFVHTYRIQTFLSLLEEGKMKELGIEGLAWEVGFNSRATFYRAFKKKMGISPSEYYKKEFTTSQ